MTDAPLIAQEIRDNAVALELAWQLRLVTIAQRLDARNALAQFDSSDNDDVPVPITLLTGPYLDGDRAYALTIPPSGNYAIANATRAPGVIVAAKQFTSGATQIASTTSAAEILLSQYSLSVPVIAGNYYHLRATFTFTLAVTTAVIIGRIRETSLAGALVNSNVMVPGSGGVFTGGYVEAWVQAATTGTQVYVVSAQRNTGAAAWSSTARTNDTFQAIEYGSAAIVTEV